jgi:hypothetical protein
LKYSWKSKIGVYSKFDPQKIGEEMMRIEVLKPESVVQYAAQDKNSELYKCLEWNNEKAGDAYRRQQARDIIHLIIVTETVHEAGEAKQIKIRAFENAADKNLGSIYIPTKKALDDPEYRECILENIRHGIEELSEKGKNYAAIINNSEKYQEGLDAAMKALGSNQHRGKKSA